MRQQAGSKLFFFFLFFPSCKSRTWVNTFQRTKEASPKSCNLSWAVSKTKLPSAPLSCSWQGRGSMSRVQQHPEDAATLPALLLCVDLPARAPSVAGRCLGHAWASFSGSPGPTAPHRASLREARQPCDWEPSWLGNTLGLQMIVFSRWGLCRSAQTLGWGQFPVGNREGVNATLAWLLLLWPLSLAQCQQLQHCWSTQQAWLCAGGCSPEGLCHQLMNYCCSSPSAGFGRVPAQPWKHLHGRIWLWAAKQPHQFPIWFFQPSKAAALNCVNKTWLIKRSGLPLQVSVESLHLPEESLEMMIFTYPLFNDSNPRALLGRNPFPLPVHSSALASHLCLGISPSWPTCTSLVSSGVWVVLFSDASRLQIFPTEQDNKPSSASPQSPAVAICHWEHCWSKPVPLSPGPP